MHILMIKKAVESYRFDHFYWCLCLFTSRSPVSVWPSSELAAWPDFSSNSENFENMRGHFVVREVTLPSSSSHAVVTDRTVLRVHHSRHQERVRVVCTTRHQHTSRFVTVSDACTSLPPFRKHVTTIRYRKRTWNSLQELNDNSPYLADVGHLLGKTNTKHLLLFYILISWLNPITCFASLHGLYRGYKRKNICGKNARSLAFFAIASTWKSN